MMWEKIAISHEEAKIREIIRTLGDSLTQGITPRGELHKLQYYLGIVKIDDPKRHLKLIDFAEEEYFSKVKCSLDKREETEKNETKI